MVEGRQQPGRPHEGVLVIYWSGGQDVKCVVLLNENRDKCRKFVASLAYTVWTDHRIRPKQEEDLGSLKGGTCQLESPLCPAMLDVGVFNVIYALMAKDCLWSGQPSDRGRLNNNKQKNQAKLTSVYTRFHSNLQVAFEIAKNVRPIFKLKMTYLPCVLKKVNHYVPFHNSGIQCQILAKFCVNNATSNCKQNTEFKYNLLTPAIVIAGLVRSPKNISVH